jgi:hypothetical protein
VIEELNVKNINDFKNKLRCPVFNKFLIRKHRTSEFIQKHFVLVFIQPFAVYYSNASYEFEFNGEAIKEEIILESFSQQRLEEIRKNVEKTIWHFFKHNLKNVLNHPRTFEVFQVDFLLDHDFFPWLLDVKNFQKLGQKPLEAEIHLSAIDLAYSLLLGIEDGFIEANSFTRIY